MVDWCPNLSLYKGPRYLALVEALQADILQGKLPVGFRLPTHRQLAKNLSLTVGTISRAYAEAERRGLISGEIGRGTFVNLTTAHPSHLSQTSQRTAVDLSTLRANALIYTPQVREGLLALASQDNLSDCLNHFSLQGNQRHQQAAATWLQHFGVQTVNPEHIVISNGAQHGVGACVAALSEPGDLIVTENICYTGIKGISSQLHRRRIEGLPMDKEGILPEALMAVCRAGNAKLLICNPKFQNPTVAMMSLERKLQIIDIARQFDLKIIEDDVFNFLPPMTPNFIDLAPERTCYVTGLTKSLLPSLRLGFIYTHANWHERIRNAIRTSIWLSSPLLTELFALWVEQGQAVSMANAQAEEARQRQALIAPLLANLPHQTHANAMHVWLYLPADWNEYSFCEAARKRGAQVVGGDVFTVNRYEIQKPAIRLSLLSADQRHHMLHGVQVLCDLLESPNHAPLHSIV